MATETKCYCGHTTYCDCGPKQETMKNIHILPTDKPSRIYLIKSNNKLGITSNNPEFTENFGGGTQNQHIHITSDEKIKEGDWFINESNQIEKGIEYYDYKVLSPESKKIILTTDQDLIKDGVQAIDDEFLEWFVKNPSCEEVKIEKFHGMNTSIAEVNFISGDGSLNWEGRSDLRDYKIIIPKEEPKQKTVEESWEDISKEFEIFYNKQNQLYRIENTPTYAFFIFLKENYTLPTKKKQIRIMLEKFKKWFYEWQNGHPFLLHEEVIIVCNTRTEEEFLHLNDAEIQTLTQIRISDMYEKKYPNAKRYSLKFKNK